MVRHSRSTGEGQDPVPKCFDHVCERRVLDEDEGSFMNKQHGVILNDFCMWENPGLQYKSYPIV